MPGDRNTRAPQWGMRLALLSWLLSVPAFAAGPSPCQAQCAGSLSKENQACVKKCPSSRKKSKRDDYQVCAQACSERFEREYAKCDKQCTGKSKGDEPPKKKRRH